MLNTVLKGAKNATPLGVFRPLQYRFLTWISITTKSTKIHEQKIFAFGFVRVFSCFSWLVVFGFDN